MDTFFALLYCKVQPSRDHTVLHNDPTVLLKVNALTFDLEFFSYLLILYSTVVVKSLARFFYMVPNPLSLNRFAHRQDRDVRVFFI